MSELSSFLFAEPSFIEGMARVLDLGGTLNEYNSSKTAKQADFFALRADWRAVGKDIQSAGLKECRRVLEQEGNDAREGRKQT